MTILLTGGSGFIGKNIIAMLGKRYDILAPSSRELNVTDEQAVCTFFTQNSVDVVIHSAVRPGHRNASDPTGQLYRNTRMFCNLARCSEYFEKLIMLGSGSTYDVRSNLAKVNEDYFDTSVPVDEGGFSKYIISKLIDFHPGKMVDLRIFGVFGPHEDYAIRFISNAICKTLFDLPVTIKQNRRFDYLYINDLMPVLEHFIHKPTQHHAYNVTPDHSVELTTIAELVRARSGKDLPILVQQDGIGLEYSGNNNRLHSEIPGLTFTPLTAAIERLYTWYEQRKNSIDLNALLTDK